MYPLPDDVRRFVLASIPSVPYLEAALWFHGQPATPRSVREVAQALYVQEQKARELLGALCAAGVLHCDSDVDAYTYAPKSPSLAQAFDNLARAYPDNLIGIAHLIHDATRKSAHRFADAFKLRKDP